MIQAEKKVIIAYFRRSTEDQENSIERQRVAFQTYLKSNASIYQSEPEVYVEDGVSGDSSVERPVQRKLLQSIESGKIQVDELFVADSSRWGRFSTHHKATFTLPLKVADVMLRTPSTLINFNDPTSDLLYDVHQNLSYIENHERSHRVTAGTATKVLAKSLKLLPCYGLKSEGGRLVEDPETAEVIRFIFRKFIQTESRNKVTHLLNNVEKVPSPKGGKWTIQTVIQILRNPKYSGHYVYGRHRTGKIHTMDGSPVPKQRAEKEKGRVLANDNYLYQEYAPDIVEPLIDLNTWGQVQLLLVKTSRPKGAINKKKFSGIFKCECGASMRGVTRKNGVHTYRCQTGRASGCTGSEFLQVEIEDSIQDFIKVIYQDNAEDLLYWQNLSNSSSKEESKNELVKLLAQYATAQARIKDLDGILPDGFIEKTRGLKKRIDVLQQQTEDNRTEESIRRLINRTVDRIRNVLADVTSDEEASSLLLKAGIIKAIALETVQQTHGKKTFNAAKRHVITYSMGNDAPAITTGYGNSDLNMTFAANRPLPRYFRDQRTKP